jgi:3-deoxy-manno-octulosonate cytidylyltransferase (CMP-KDO synthetase)
MLETLIVIPARLKATRLPDKPLALIEGEPMIVHVWRRAMEANCGPVLVATDAPSVEVAVRKAGGDSGRKVAAIVNLQGDLPTLDPSLVRSCLATIQGGKADIGTLAAEIRREEERTDPNVVKVVGSPLDSGRTMRALYFTRATAPHGEGPHYHHIGIYAYTRDALERFVKLPPSALEKRERLEQLRALEGGLRIDVALVDTVPLGVDTPAELARARELLKSRR